MARYRCYFRGRDGLMLGAEDIDSNQDREAIEKARKRLASEHDFAAFELWHRERWVFAEMRAEEVS